MMRNFPDTNLYFGEAGTNGAFANEVYIGASQADRMHVRVFVKEDFAGGTSMAFKLQGKKGNGGYADIASAAAVTTANLKKGSEVAVIEIPEGTDADTLKVVGTASGLFSGGKAEAWIDTNLGL